MSKSKEKRGRLLEADLQNILIARAKRVVPGFIDHFAKFEQQMLIEIIRITLFNYSRVVAKISLHFKKSLLDFDPDVAVRFIKRFGILYKFPPLLPINKSSFKLSYVIEMNFSFNPFSIL